MGPRPRYLGSLVPAEPQLWQDPVPVVTAKTVTPPRPWLIRRTGWESITRLPSDFAARIETSCEPPTNRLSCAPPAVLISRSIVPGVRSLPAEWM